MSTATHSRPETPTAPEATRGLVEITKVRKSFGATEVLKGITLTVEPGGVAVIVGPSGSGAGASPVGRRPASHHGGDRGHPDRGAVCTDPAAGQRAGLARWAP